MKNFFRNILAIGLVAFGLATQAQQAATWAVTNGINTPRTSGTAIFELQITDTSASANTISIYDNSSTSTTNTVKPSYISYAYSRLTNSTTFTNLAGVVQTNNFVYLSRVATTNAAVTNLATLVYRTIVPSSGTQTIIPLNPFTFGLGVQIVAASNATLNVTYTPLP